MNGKVNRQTVDLTAYPDLVVIYLGMRVNAMTGIKTLIGFGPKIAKSVLTSIGGNSSCVIQAAQLFGTKRISCAAGWRDFMPTCLCSSAS